MFESTILIPYSYSLDDDARIQFTGTDSVLHMIITEYSEQHKDNAAQYNMLSDSIALYSYGASPVEVEFSGYVLEDWKNNHLFSLLTDYKEKWRCRLAANDNSPIKLHCMDAEMYFGIISINIEHNSDVVGYAKVSISGLGWQYNCTGLPSMSTNITPVAIQKEEENKEEDSTKAQVLTESEAQSQEQEQTEPVQEVNITGTGLETQAQSEQSNTLQEVNVTTTPEQVMEG